MIRSDFATRRLGAAATALVAAAALSLSAVQPAAQALNIAAPSGVDVSSNQHLTTAGINWDAVKSDGHSYAFVKATEGEGWTNEHYLADARAALNAGLKVGAYHYARPAGDPVAQARDFAAQIARVPGMQLPPVLDLEVAEGRSPQELIAWTRAFTTELQLRTGRTPMIYTYRYFWTDHMANTTQFSEFPLWLAAYQNQAPAPVGGWKKLAFWQRSDSGRVNGITGPVDLNLFNGNAAQLEAFAAGNHFDFGGMLEGLVIPGVDLSGDARAAIAGILALAAGAAVAPGLTDVNLPGGNELTQIAQALIDNDALPVRELERMARNGASLSDLAMLLDNAAHVSNTDVTDGAGGAGATGPLDGANAGAAAASLTNAANAAKGLNLGGINASEVAGTLTRLFQR
ncbi:glycoside hydrolase family 25 protein [Corynebacterium lizhenjunii]|uniref:glycoside hydrolase family 25 protein n=1 Tax=Corynebacterium lizhenjunii TaxID=2709394 RepID=UPI0013EC61FC|nr:glycoside hydrolase family 25 protein [Corynebacterium lizhenjunii]